MSNIKAFVSKPVTVRAVQWTGTNLPEIQAFMAPASPHFQPGYRRTPPLDDVRPVLQVHVPDDHANEQWPQTGPHFRLVPVPLNGWLVVKVNDRYGFLQVLTSTQMTEQYTEEPIERVVLPDGVVKLPASQAAALTSEAAAVMRNEAAFQLGAPLKASHPRSQSTSDVRVAPPEPRVASREPSAEDGATVDREPEF